MSRSARLTRLALPAVVLATAAMFVFGPLSCSRSSGTAPLPEVSGDLAVVNVTVVNVVAGAEHPGMTVVVKGDRITDVRPTAGCRVADGTRVIDGAGKYLIPGLWDMHAHVVDEGMVKMFLDHGVTGVRHMFGYNPAYTYRAPATPSEGPIHPRVVAAHNLLDGEDTVFPWLLSSKVVKVKDADTARAGVRELKARGNDMVKMYSSLPREAFFVAICEAKSLGLLTGGHVPHWITAGEASDAGFRTFEHLAGVALQCSTREAIHRAKLIADRRAAVTGNGAERADAETGWREQVVAHETFGPAKADALFRKFVANGSWHVPTLVTARAMARMGDRDAVPADVEKSLPSLLRFFWTREFAPNGDVRLPRLGLNATPADLKARAVLLEKDTELVRKMHRAGVRILAGSDTPSPLVVPGLGLHEELELLVAAGLTPAEALRAATIDAARCLGRESDLGTVEAGKVADLVLLSANPLADIRNTRAVELVTVGGRVAER